MARPRILLVEHDPAMASMITDLLQDAYEVDGPYGSLSDGVAAVAEHFPQGAILDVGVGGGDIGLLADDLEQYDIPYLLCVDGERHAVIDAHRDAPRLSRGALATRLGAAVRRMLH